MNNSQIPNPFSFYSIVQLIVILLLFQSCGSSPKFTGKEPTAKTGSELPPPSEIEQFTDSEKDEIILETTSGIASYYGEKFNGRQTASGEIYNINELTAAHLNYPFGTIVRVTNTKNKQSVILKINDRMPDYNGRVIDVSYQAAKELGMLIDGLAKVSIEVLSWGNKN
jgi:rare lipoprotein A